MDTDALRDKLHLSKSIQYQQGSVVSRELFKSHKCTITLFAFGAGQGLSPHATPYDAFAHIIDGDAEIPIGDMTYQLMNSEMIHMPANTMHSLRACSETV
jgi:quercetin dioxygenase-like cupin family protein